MWTRTFVDFSGNSKRFLKRGAERGAVCVGVVHFGALHREWSDDPVDIRCAH